MDRSNIYEILIELDNSYDSLLFKGKIDYSGSSTFKDDVEIYRNRIIIVASRSSNIDLSTIFYNLKSSLYGQIIKTLVYYYIVCRTENTINIITINRKRGNNILDSKVLKKPDINQIISKRPVRKYAFDKNKIQILFTETPKGKAILNSLSYYIKATCMTDDAERFERFWKSFNPLYRLIGSNRLNESKIEEFKCLCETRNHIEEYPECFINSIKQMSGVNAENLRKLRWRDMILNNYPHGTRINDYKKAVFRYTDSRIMNCYLETIGNVDQYLKADGSYERIFEHLTLNIKNNKIKDLELISFFILRYMYYVRNKAFHGEKLDATFRLTINKEAVEFKLLNGKLEAFIVDLINSNDIL